MQIGMKISGVDSTIANIKSIMREMPNELAAAMYREAELTMAESQKEIPVDTAAAKDSKFVNEPEITRKEISVTLGYGGVAAKTNPDTGESVGQYIEYLHEDLNATHTVGKAKFLSDPAKRRAKVLYTNLVKRVQKIVDKRRATK